MYGPQRETYTTIRPWTANLLAIGTEAADLLALPEHRVGCDLKSIDDHVETVRGFVRISPDVTSALRECSQKRNAFPPSSRTICPTMQHQPRNAVALLRK